MTTCEDCTDTIAAMMQQERKFYQCPDYLGAAEEPSLSPLDVVFEIAGLVTDLRITSKDEKEKSFLAPSSPVRHLTSSPHSSMNNLEASAAIDTRCSSKSLRSRRRPQRELTNLAAWRQQMLGWASQVTQAYRIPRDTIPAAFSILDRYVAKLCSNHEQITRDDFHLFAMVSMFTAVKIMAPYQQTLAIAALIDMSRGFYTEEDIVETERDILETLNWHVHPPIAMDYCRYFIRLFPVKVAPEIEETCAFVSELALDDTYFISKPSSMVALATMIVAACRHKVSLDVAHGLLENLKGLMDVQSAELDALIKRIEVLC